MVSRNMRAGVLLGAVLVGACTGQVSRGTPIPIDPGAGGASSGGAGTGGDPDPTLIPARVRRITNAEYDQSVQALLGTSLTLGAAFTADTRQLGFSVNAAQRVDPVLVDQLKSAAETLAHEAVSARLATLAPCATASPDESCARSVIDQLGRKAYRRPLTALDQTNLLTVYRAGATGGTFQDGVELVLRAMLQSASFLYVTELGTAMPGKLGVTALTQHEVASEIAYVFTGGPPDDALLTRADAGGLASADDREAEARRMLGLFGTRFQFERFIQQWLGIDQLDHMAKDPAANASFRFDDIRAPMQDETNAFIDEVMIHDGASVKSLLSADYSVVPPPLAGFYGLSAVGSGRTPYGTLPRRGILTQASFLAAHSHEVETGPVVRGATVLRQVLCIALQKPTTLKIQIVPPAPDPSLTTRERFSQHSLDSACTPCHHLIDPVGFAFEEFDALGAYRTTENNKPIDTSGSLLAGSDVDGPFANAMELAQKLAASEVARSCFARQMFRFASAQSSADTETAFLDFWKDQTPEVQSNLLELFVAYARSDMFVTRSVR